MDREGTALGVGGPLQRRLTGAAQGVLGVVLVVGPGERHLGGAHKAADIVHVLVGLVVIDAPGQPKDLFGPQGLQELGLDLGLGHFGVASGAQKAAFRGENGALAVGMDGAALQDEGVSVQHRVAEEAAELRRHGVVLLPVGIETVHVSAPGVELPVHAHPAAQAVDQEGGAHVPGPGVVALQLQHLHSGGDGGAGLGQVVPAGQKPDLLVGQQGLHNPAEGLLGRFPAVGPGAGAHRPDQQRALVGGIFGGHIEFATFHQESRSLKSE